VPLTVYSFSGFVDVCVRASLSSLRICASDVVPWPILVFCYSTITQIVAHAGTIPAHLVGGTRQLAVPVILQSVMAFYPAIHLWMLLPTPPLVLLVLIDAPYLIGSMDNLPWVM